MLSGCGLISRYTVVKLADFGPAWLAITTTVGHDKVMFLQEFSGPLSAMLTRMRDIHVRFFSLFILD